MPIYAYKCDSCGFAKDVLQKMSDPPLSDCPACHAAGFRKQVTAAGFQLKGSGWYVTDFKGGSGGAAAKPDDKSSSEAAAGKTDAGGDAKSGGATESKPESKPAAEPAARKAAAASTSGTGSDS